MTSPTEPPELRDTDLPAWWQWLRRHRKAVLVVAGVLVVGLVATFGGIAIFSPGPKDVVEDYLDAIRAGDTDAALAIAGKPNLGDRLDFVNTDAMADGWTVDAVVEHNRREATQGDEADVDVTIGTRTESVQGRFHLVDREDGWRIDAPFVEVDMKLDKPDTITLGTVTRKVEGVNDSGEVAVLLFPGVYRLGSGGGDLVSLSPNEFFAAPRPDRDDKRGYAPTRELTDTGTEQAQQALDAYLDKCAKQNDEEPSGCPFSAQDVVEYWEEVRTLAWRITTHPRAHFEANDDGGFTAVTRTPGAIRLTWSGYDEQPPVRSFSAVCEFGFGDPRFGRLTVDASTTGVTVNPISPDASYGAESSTKCH